jgi:hypothetical protein
MNNKINPESLAAELGKYCDIKEDGINRTGQQKCRRNSV